MVIFKNNQVLKIAIPLVEVSLSKHRAIIEIQLKLRFFAKAALHPLFISHRVKYPDHQKDKRQLLNQEAYESGRTTARRGESHLY